MSIHPPGELLEPAVGDLHVRVQQQHIATGAGAQRGVHGTGQSAVLDDSQHPCVSSSRHATIALTSGESLSTIIASAEPDSIACLIDSRHPASSAAEL